MNKNENGGLNLSTTPETTDLQELLKGCNRAIVAYSIEEACFEPKGFKTRKIVVLFDEAGFDRETINKNINGMMIMHGQSLVKSHMYVANCGKWKKAIFSFAAYLLRPILGVAAGEDIIDLTKKSKDYNQGRGLSW